MCKCFLSLTEPDHAKPIKIIRRIGKTFENETLRGLNIPVEIDIIEIFECNTDMSRNERFFSASATYKK